MRSSIDRTSNYVIFGAGNVGKTALVKLQDNYKDSICFFIDTNKKGEWCNKPVISPEEYKYNNETVIIANDNPYSVVDMFNVALSKGFEKIYWFLNFDDDAPFRTSFLEDECLDISNWGDCVLPDLEVHIADNCNLNCKGCTHFSPLFSEIGVDFVKCLDDVKRLKSKFSSIARLDILGGEPLLNPELERYVCAFREILPDTRISVFSNGLLIPKLSDKVISLLAENKVAFMISLYPPTARMVSRIKSVLNKNNVRYQITPSRDVFVLPITTCDHSRHPQRCISDGCVSISNGKIARCPTLLYIHKFNEIFHANLPEEGIYNIDELSSGSEIRNVMRKEVPLCKHCIYSEIPWSVCGKEIQRSDFAMDD